MRSALLSAAVLIVIAGLGAFDSARAAALAFDSAADPAYAPYLDTATFPAGINGGYGWRPWEEWYAYTGSLTVSPNVHLDATRTSASWLQSPLTSPGAVWAVPFIFDRSVTTYVVRHLDESLAVGQTLSFDFEYVPVIGILSPNGRSATYEIDPGNPDRVWFEHSLPNVFFQTNVSDTDVGGHISITPIDAGDATLSITSYGPLGRTESLELPYADVDGVAFQANPVETGHYGYINNFSVTPEPASAAIIAAVGLGLALRRNRRSRSSIT